MSKIKKYINYLRRNWKMVLAVLYLISPIDIIPEAILPAIGLSDDILVLLYFVLRSLNKERKLKKQKEFDFEENSEIKEAEIIEE